MKKLILVLSAFALLPACETIPNPSAVCEVGAATLIDDKALYAAEVAYNVPAHAYVTADQEGKLSASLKANLKPKLLEMYRLLGLVRNAKGTFNCDLNSLKALSAEVNSRIPR